MSASIEAIKVRRLYLQVAERIQQLIEAGTYTTGSRLPAERELASQLGVSRPTIREAIIALEIGGLVEVRSGSGVYVLERAEVRALPEIEAPGPFEILEARRLFESEACALAAKQISPEQLQQLAQLLAVMEQAGQTVEQAETVDQQFHCAIAEASGNSAVSATVAWLWQLRNESEISTRFHQRVREEGSRPIVADHQLILRALVAGDSDAARDAMASHLQRVIDSLLEQS